MRTRTSEIPVWLLGTLLFDSFVVVVLLSVVEVDNQDASSSAYISNAAAGGGDHHHHHHHHHHKVDSKRKAKEHGNIAVVGSALVPLTPDRANHFIRLASSYLVRICHKNGRFTYLANANTPLKRAQKHQEKYNLLRHNGAIYALGQVAQHLQEERNLHPNKQKELDEVQQAMQRSVSFLKRHAIRRVPVGVTDSVGVGMDDLESFPETIPGLWAAWETKGTHYENIRTPTAKLGGAGLALVAFTSLERTSSSLLVEHTALEEMRGLAAFIEFMQNPDGSFTDRYRPAKGGKDAAYICLFYPGEACLGLISLAQLETDPIYQKRWMSVAVKALLYLEQVRRQQSPTQVPKDHWALLATARLWPSLPKYATAEESQRIYQHAVQLVRSMVLHIPPPSAHVFAGCLTYNCHTCATATLLEGLVASLDFIHAEETLSNGTLLRERVLQEIRLGVQFLVSAQITDTRFDMQGGIPYQYPIHHSADGEVRVDYVQHALSAVLTYQKFMQAQTQQMVPRSMVGAPPSEKHHGFEDSSKGSTSSLLVPLVLLTGLVIMLATWLNKRRQKDIKKQRYAL